MQQETIERPDGSTIEAEVIVKGSIHRRTKTTQVSEPVVDEHGNVQAVIVQTRLDKPGVTLVTMHEGQLQLTRHARKRGYVFYRDMCLGVVPGVEASPIHWKIYEKIRQMVSGGQRVDVTPEMIFHPEVLRRRGAHTNGHRRVGVDKMAEIIGELREAGAGVDLEQATARAKATGMVLPKEDSDQGLDALIASAEKKKKGKRGHA
jgi:hypothetical protein